MINYNSYIPERSNRADIPPHRTVNSRLLTHTSPSVRGTPNLKKNTKKRKS